MYFGSFREGTLNIYWKLANGAGREELLIRLTGVFNDPLSLSPDGQHLILRRLNEETGEDLMLVSMGEERELTSYLGTGFNELAGSISPDGKWIAFTRSEGRPAPMDIWIVTAAGEDQRNITRSPNGVDNWAPSWGP